MGAEALRLLDRAADYVERFADLNGEPNGGDCRDLLAKIRRHLEANPPPVERPRVEVYEYATGHSGMFWPLDLGASRAVAMALANNRMEELNGTGGRYGVRVVGAPDDDVADDLKRARDAGYLVEYVEPPQTSSESGWDACTAKGEAILSGIGRAGLWPSERAAWEACDRHRRFGEVKS